MPDNHDEGAYLGHRLTPQAAGGDANPLSGISGGNPNDIHGAHTAYQKERANRNPNRNDPRERLARELLARGHATMDEILRASYGVWPPQGLDIIGQNDQTIILTELVREPHADPAKGHLTNRAEAKMSGNMASAPIHGPRSIAVDHFKLSTLPLVLNEAGLLQTAFIHEATHNLQSDHHGRVIETFGRMANQESRPRVHDHTSDTIAKEIWNIYADPERVKDLGAKPGHLISGREIQARIAQVMPDGYQHWGIMPQNREELFVALEGMGLKPPPEIMSQLENSPTINQTRKIFSSGENTSPLVIGQLNKAINTLTPEGQIEFWKKGIPLLYSDMIEMLGDRQGRARFGLGENPHLALRENQAALRNLIRNAAWESVTDADGQPAKRLDFSQIPSELRSKYRDAFEVSGINPEDSTATWPPSDLGCFEWTVRGADLERLNALQKSAPPRMDKDSARVHPAQSNLTF